MELAKLTGTSPVSLPATVPRPQTWAGCSLNAPKPPWSLQLQPRVLPEG